jgi:hypothetical protein
VLQGIQIFCLCLCSWLQRSCIIYPPQYKHTRSKMYNRCKRAVHCVGLDPSNSSIWPNLVISQMSKCQSVCVRLSPVPQMLQKQLHLPSLREATFVWKAFSAHKAEERTNGSLITEKRRSWGCCFHFQCISSCPAPFVAKVTDRQFTLLVLCGFVNLQS